MWLVIWLVFCISNEYHLCNALCCTVLFILYLKPGDLIPELYRLETLARGRADCFLVKFGHKPQAQPSHCAGPRIGPCQICSPKTATCRLGREVNWAMTFLRAILRFLKYPCRSFLCSLCSNIVRQSSGSELIIPQFMSCHVVWHFY